MIYSLDLQTALILTGLALILSHGWAFLKPARAQQWLRAFPRSKTIGVALLFVVTLWSWILIKTIDLGEFSNWRPRLLIFIPVAAVLTWKYVDEFLAARALGMLALLVAEPLLESAFLRPEPGRLFLVTLVYVWIVLGLFWIGMPYTLRDQVLWVTKHEGRWKTAALTGVCYGVLLLILPATLHR